MTDRDHFAAAALTGLLAQGDDGSFSEESYVRGAYRWADAMLRERAKTNHDAAPAARASVESVAPQPTTHGESDRTDKAAPRPSEGTGDTPDSPQPIACSVFDRSQPIAKPTPVHTPPAHATPSVGSVPRDGTEPVAWAVCTPSDGHWSPCYFHEPHAQRCANAIVGEKNIVPLYRHPPTLTDAEREAAERASIAYELLPTEGAQQVSATLRGLLERLGGVE